MVSREWGAGHGEWRMGSRTWGAGTEHTLGLVSSTEGAQIFLSVSPGASMCPSLSGIPRDVPGQGRASSPSWAQVMPLGTWGASSALLGGYRGAGGRQVPVPAPPGAAGTAGPPALVPVPQIIPQQPGWAVGRIWPGTRAGDTWGRGTSGPGPQRGVGEVQAAGGG